MKFSFFTTVDRIFKHEPIVRGRKVKDENGNDVAEFETENKGWFVALKGSFEALHFGFEKPDCKPGQQAKVTVEFF